MTNILKNIGLVIAGVIVGLLFSAISVKSNPVGGVYNQVTKYFYDGINVGTSGQYTISSTGAVTNTASVTTGTNGSTISFVKATTCNLVGGTIAATSSAVGDCAVTGVVAGDLVIPTLATSTANVVATGARASSTAGFVTVRLLNLTGSASSFTAVGSSTTLFIFRAQ